MRMLFLILAVPFLATFAPTSLWEPPQAPPRSTVSVTPVALDEARPDRRRAGRLIFLEGWVIRSNDHRFGGLSALHMDGRRVLALSDAGSVIRFTLPRAAGTVPVSIEPINLGPGAVGDKRNRDSESMAVAGGKAWVGFERSNSIWRYDRERWTFEAAAAPPAMRRWSANSGPEAMVRLPDSRFLVFSEGRPNGGGATPLLLFDRDPSEAGAEAVEMRYRAPEGYRITDSALLPDGRLLLLNRRMTLLEGVSARLTVTGLEGLREGAVIAGEEIARLEAPLTVDNMEGLSVAREGGRTILWIASDDNFMELQRTLLLKFALQE